MEAQMQQRPEHENDGLLSGESNQPGEKKSLMKKVKDKAKKIFKKQSHNSEGQENEYTYDESPDKEDDADEEIANDRAPMNDSNVISSTDKKPMQLVHFPEKPTHTHEDRYDPMVKGEAKARPNIPVQTGCEQEMPPENKHFPSPMKPISVQGEEANSGEPEVKLGPSMGLEDDPHSPKISPGEYPVPPPNYESNKVSDPAGDGGKEAGVSPLIRRFDNLNVGGESETKPEPKQSPYTGSHDQFYPQPTPTQDDEFNPESNPVSKLDNNPESDPKNFDSNKTEDMPRDTVAGKVSSAISDKTNMVASKLGYGTGSGQEGMSHGSETKQSPYTGSHDQFYPQPTPTQDDKFNPESNQVRNLDNNPESDPKSFDSDKTEDMPRDTVAGKVSSAISDKTNVVASKLGYGTGSGQEGRSHESETTPGYTQKITETLNPVYEKVAGAGTAVLSKFQGGGEPAAADKGTEKEGGSMNEYLAEKLKPGEEDKALSEAITEGYYQKTGQEKKPMWKVSESDEVARAPHPEETCLDESKKKGEGEDAAGRESSGPGVVGRMKDAVGSWLGMGTGTQSAQDSSIKESHGSSGQGDGVAGEQPRL